MSEATRPLTSSDAWLKLAVAQQLLQEAELAEAAAKAKTEGTDPATVLLNAKKLQPAQVGSLKAEAAGVAFVDVADYQVEADALKLIPEAAARKYQVLPLYRLNNALTVAVADPWNAVAIDALRATTRLPIINPVVGTPEAIRKAIEHHYSLQVMDTASKADGAAAADLSSAQAAVAAKPATEAANEVSVVKLFDALLGEALDARASDIHLEPDLEHMRVRFRVDGVLHEIKLLPRSLHDAICSRVKILAKLDITEHRVPQDGHIPLTLDGRLVDLRISTYPTVLGENIVIRLLDQSAVGLKLTELGFADDALRQFRTLIQRPYGLLLVTGPTGSGKTTTLYAGLSEINSMTRNLMTIEDPVEYQLSLIRQTQVNPKAGITFATGLRAILRQDPDVIMVGEIRDQETAEIAVNAALTGHLVLTTLHTSSAVGAVARLFDLGVEPYLLANTLLGAVGQRLVRRICPQCQEGSRLPKELREQYPDLSVTYRGRGCRSCRKTGFAGRLGCFELFVVDDDMKERIATQASAEALKAQGMRTMRADGLLKVQRGLTTLEEVNRVVPPDVAS